VATELDRIAETVRALMAPYSGAWALCGGWAVDIWLGEVTREHGDIDIAVFRDDERRFAVELADWRLVAHETDDADHQVRWDGHPLVANAHLHAASDLEPRRELLLNERGEGGWLLGRWTSGGDRTAALPLHRFALPSAAGIPVMAPEAIAFYKAVGDRRPHDDEDLERLMTLLDDEQRAWLEAATSPRPRSP
jgi:hypothetical protein